MDKSLLLPASILIGAAIIAAGLYFGLSAQRPSEVAPASEPPASTAAAPEAAPEVVAATAAPPSPEAPADQAAVRETAKRDAAFALGAQRAVFKTKCWDPAFAKESSPATSKVLFQMSFSPEGKEIGRGISELRGVSRSDVAQCLRGLPLGLTIGPPGMPLSVDVELTLP